MKKSAAAKKMTIMILAGILAIAGLSGCSGDDSKADEQEAQESQALLEKLDALQTQVSGIETYLMGEEDDQPKIVMAGLKSAQQFLNQFDEFEERVCEAAVAADAVTTPENEDERPAAYFEAIAPLEELEADLALLEDAFITAHGKGTIKSKELWQLEARKGEIEDMISLAKDSLRFRMSTED